MRLVVDTNVIVSGLLKAGGPPGRILDGIVQGVIVPVYSGPIVAEYRAVLARVKFGFDAGSISALLDLIASHGWHVLDVPRVDIHFRDPGDQPFYACAAAAGCALVTGNVKHFPPQGPVEVVTPRHVIMLLRGPRHSSTA